MIDPVEDWELTERRFYDLFLDGEELAAPGAPVQRGG